MPFGIIDPTLPKDVEILPGTEYLIGGDQNAHAVEAGNHEGRQLKHVMYKGVETILIPQPSDDDANDPLLWPRWQKEAAFWVIFVNSIIFAILPGPIIAPATFALAPILGVSLTNVSQLSGYQLLTVAALGPMVSVLAQKYGKRPQFLFAAATGTLGTIICIVGSSQSRYGTLLGGRIVQGLGVTAWESISLSALGDMFYLHERGLRTSIIVCSLACMASLVSIISGVLFQNHGYHNLFVAELPFNVAGLLATVFLLPETQYLRSTTTTTTTMGASVTNNSSSPKPRGSIIQEEDDKKDLGEEEGRTQNIEHATTTPTPTPTPTQHRSADGLKLAQQKKKKRGYWRGLVPWSGTVYTDKSILRLLAEIFIHLLNPAVFWILMVSAVLVCFFVVSAYILSQLFSVAPYNLDVAANGYFWTGAFVGGLLAVGVGPLCDWTARTMARLNDGGVFEAEFRIPVNVLGAFFVGLGWFLFMWVVDHPTARGYFLASFCHGCVCFGISVPSTSAGLYILDSFPRQSTEVFVLQMMLKNFLFYAFSTFINTWAAEKGGGEVFKVFGIASLALIALCIPMYIFGKLNRKFMHRLYTQSSIFKALT